VGEKIAVAHFTEAVNTPLRARSRPINRTQALAQQTQGAEKVSLFCSTILFQNRRMIYGYARVSTEA
jgi:hypothetical protein